MTIAHNPILPGFYPDPSICAVGDKFYLINSTFAYYPGVPIFESKDLAHWKQIGNILNRESQLKMEGFNNSNGIYASTIRYHEGTFYMITTIIPGGNIIVTATNPEGPWSEPHFLEGAEGIDPSLLFDGDKCYYVGMRSNPEGEKFFGDSVIYAWELDLNTWSFVGDYHVIWNGSMRDAEWSEGPHLYKKDGWYYVMMAEGGTGLDHAVTIARSKDIFGWYEGYRRNPILTHRHLGKNEPVRYVGHADLVETQNGDWYMVCLASRHINGCSNLGRETYIAEVVWEDGWPVVNPGYGKLREEQEIKLTEFIYPDVSDAISFNQDILSHRFITLQTPKDNFYSLTERKGVLRLYLKPEVPTELKHFSYLAIRQQQFDYTATVSLEFDPKSEKETAGLMLYQSNQYQIRAEVGIENKEYYIAVINRAEDKDVIIKKKLDCKDIVFEGVPTDRLTIRIRFRQSGQKLEVKYDCNGTFVTIQDSIDTSNLCSEKASGFVGSTIGVYATSNGAETQSYVDIIGFEYKVKM